MVNKILDQGERVPILHSHCIKRPVVLDKPVISRETDHG
jgi:hypothetical protein